MTKKQMVRRIAAELDLDQKLTARVVQGTLDAILEAVAGSGRIELRNFGVFEVRARAPRKARNPRSNQEVLIPARSVLSFQPGKNVAAMIDRAFPVSVRPGPPGGSRENPR